MRVLRALLVLVLALWLVLELASVPLAESEVERQVEARSEDVTAVSADIDSFPLVTGLVSSGTVRRLAVTLTEVVRQQVTLSEVRFELEGIELDRSALLARDVEVRSIDRGSVTATIDLGALGGVVGRIGSLAGIEQARVQGGILHVGPASLPIGDDLFPCDPTGVIEGDHLTLSCAITELPPSVLEGAGTRF